MGSEGCYVPPTTLNKVLLYKKTNDHAYGRKQGGGRG